jgi:hypothetical protein
MWQVAILAAAAIAPFLADTSPPPPPPVEPLWAPSTVPGQVTERVETDGSMVRIYGPVGIVPARYRVLVSHRFRRGVEGAIEALRASGVRVAAARFPPRDAAPDPATGAPWVVLEVYGEGAVGQQPPFTAVSRASLPWGTSFRVRDPITRRGWVSRDGRWRQVEGPGNA